MQSAFGTTLGIYDDGKQQFRARTGVLRLPQDLLPVVEAVLGLDTRPAAQPLFVRAEGPVDPEVITGHLPNAVGTLYSFPTGLTGARQCIGIVELGGGYNESDIVAAFAAMGLAAPTVVAVSVDGGQNAPGSSDDVEVALDIQVAGGVAPGSRIAVYFAPNTFQTFVNAITQAALDPVNAPSVISISWGAVEGFWADMDRNSMNSALADAAGVGVSVFVAAGDSLATSGVNDGKAHVFFPAASPSAIGCGGTTIDTAGSRINSEVVWNDHNNISGTGGGISDFYAVPDFQQSTNLPVSVNDGQRRRGVPDVSADASLASGYLIVLRGSLWQVGGTSAVAPLWAGLTALINQAAGEARGPSIGFFLPALYQNPQLLRDITQGDNKVRGLGYSAGPGWDACTGLGVPIGSALERAASIR